MCHENTVISVNHNDNNRQTVEDTIQRLGWSLTTVVDALLEMFLLISKVERLREAAESSRPLER